MLTSGILGRQWLLLLLLLRRRVRTENASWNQRRLTNACFREWKKGHKCGAIKMQRHLYACRVKRMQKEIKPYILCANHVCVHSCCLYVLFATGICIIIVRMRHYLLMFSRARAHTNHSTKPISRNRDAFKQILWYYVRSSTMPHALPIFVLDVCVCVGMYAYV